MYADKNSKSTKTTVKRENDVLTEASGNTGITYIFKLHA